VIKLSYFNGNQQPIFPRKLTRHLPLAAAMLVMAGGYLAPRFAYAEDAASCIDKCKAEEKKCVHDGASEELCDYDSKNCQKACGGEK